MSTQSSALNKIDIGINEKDRQAIADGLSTLLADTLFYSVRLIELT